MPKRRAVTVSPEASLKKSRAPPSKRKSSENGVKNDELTPEEADMIVETASTSSGENVTTADQVSEDEEMEEPKVNQGENGVTKEIVEKVDWLGLGEVQDEFYVSSLTLALRN